MLFIRLNPGSFVPLYSQIQTAITGLIKRGQLEPGDLLPSEKEFCQSLGVSRSTLRQALVRLEKDGLIASHQGKGTFVAKKQSSKHLAVALLVIGFSEQIYQTRQGVYGSLVRGITEVTASRQVLFNIFHFPIGSSFAASLTSVDPAIYDGVLVRLYENIRAQDIESLEAHGLPYVVIKRRLHGRMIDAVINDEVKGGFLAVDHLLSLGHRRIAVVSGPPEIQVFSDRIAGAKQAMAKYGLALDPDLVRSAPNSIDQDGFKCTLALLRHPSPPQAIFVASDMMAIGAYEAISGLRLRIPQNVSIVGFDDVEVACRLTPPLTTVRTSYFDLGKTATLQLIDLLTQKVSSPVETILEPSLIVRESTAAYSGSER